MREKILPHLTVQHEEWDNQELNIVSTHTRTHTHTHTHTLYICGVLVQECLMDPGCYRAVEEVVREETRGRGLLDYDSVELSNLHRQVGSLQNSALAYHVIAPLSH